MIVKVSLYWFRKLLKICILRHFPISTIWLDAGALWCRCHWGYSTFLSSTVLMKRLPELIANYWSYLIFSHHIWHQISFSFLSGQPVESSLLTKSSIIFIINISSSVALMLESDVTWWRCRSWLVFLWHWRC